MTYMYRRVHPWGHRIGHRTGTQRGEPGRGTGEGSESGTIQRHAYEGWFNIYFHDFHTVLYMCMTFENCKNIFFLAMVFGCG
jgi:hypothetical protein